MCTFQAVAGWFHKFQWYTDMCQEILNSLERQNIIESVIADCFTSSYTVEEVR